MVFRREVGAREELTSAMSDVRDGGSDVIDDSGRERRFVLALAATITFALGGVALVFGLVVGTFLTALLCSVLVICVVGLAVAML